MIDLEKINKLEKEIEELKKKKADKDKVNKLLAERNRLKLPWLYKVGDFAKETGQGLVRYADKKAKEGSEQEKKRSKRKSKDLPKNEESEYPLGDLGWN